MAAESTDESDREDDGAPECSVREAVPSPKLLEFLVCPLTKTTLELSQDRSELISRAARLAFPIRDGVPLLTRDTARELKDEDLKR